MDRKDAVLLQLGLMVRVVMLGEQAAVDERMERLHAAAEDFREAGHFIDRRDRDAVFLQMVHRPAGRQDLIAERFQFLCELQNAGLVRYAEQCSLFHG